MKRRPHTMNATLAAFFFGAIATFGTISAPKVAAGAGSPQLPPLPAQASPIAPGTWVRYSVVDRKSGNAISLRLAALAKEQDAQWIEVSITDQAGQTTVFASLILGPLTAPKKVLKIVLQPPGQQPLLLPTRAEKFKFPQYNAQPAAQRAATRRVKVPAGTFRAHYHRTRDSESWVSDRVAGWPLVSTITPKLHLELLAHGTDARSMIHGNPTKIDPGVARQLGY